MLNTIKVISLLIGLVLVAYLIESMEFLALKAVLVATLCAITIVAIYHAVAKSPSFLDEEGKLVFNKTTTTETPDGNKEYTQKLIPLNTGELKKTVEEPTLITTEVKDDGVSIDRLREIIEEESKKPKRKPSKPRVKKTVADGK